MPYIKKADRYVGRGLEEYVARTPGELNFLLTKIVKAYMDQRGLSYGTINDIVGALEGAKLEFYRRVAIPYENTKITQNGDVYDA